MADGDDPAPRSSEEPPADDPVQSGPEERDPARPRRRWRQVIGWSMLGLGIFVLLSVFWVAYRSYEAYDHLKTASDEVSTLQRELENFTDADPTEAARTVQLLQQETAAARSAVNDPIFRIATVTPFLGANFDALREVTLTVDSLANDVMPSLVDIAATLAAQPAGPEGRHDRPDTDRADLTGAARCRRRGHGSP